MHKPSRSARRLGVALALVAGLGLMAAPQRAKAWEPEKPVELIVMAAAGGGADQIARLFQSIIEKRELSPVPFVVVNKPGGSGAEALRYLSENAGNVHVLLITLNSIFTTPLLDPGLGVDVTDYTPVARMAMDTFLLWVNADSGIESLDGYIKAVRAKGTAWKMGGTGSGQEDSLVTAMLEAELDVKVTYIPFAGGGTVARNLSVGHVDSTVNNPSEQMGYFESGQARPLMAMTPERLPQFPDVPTSAELGHPGLVYFMQRSVVAPSGISSAVRDWYIGLFRKVNGSEEWAAFTESDSLFRDWLAGDDLAAYFENEVEKHRRLLKTAGELQ